MVLLFLKVLGLCMLTCSSLVGAYLLWVGWRERPKGRDVPLDAQTPERQALLRRMNNVAEWRNWKTPAEDSRSSDVSDGVAPVNAGSTPASATIQRSR